ncbi:MAG: tetratricopeptide repeat protein [Planctomycetes bacterium]|nr:tetratricopeptide repeat protein [Planctomycetota bacterium]
MAPRTHLVVPLAALLALPLLTVPAWTQEAKDRDAEAPGGKAASKDETGDGSGDVSKADAEAKAASKEAAPGELLRRGDYEGAAEGFEAALEREPGSAAAARGLAEALAAVGKHDEALAAVTSARDAERSATLLCTKGRLHLRRGRLREAEEAFRAALAADKGDVEASNRLGEVLWKTGRLEEARKVWNDVVAIYEEMSPDDAERVSPEAFVEMGLALVGLNRFKEANEVMFSSARDKDPKCPALLLESGRIFLEKYNYPDSRDYLKEAIEQNRNFADAHVVLAENFLADFQVGTPRYEQADKHVKEALRVAPSHADAYTARGALSLSDGNAGAAAADFQKSIELDPSSLRARGYLAACRYLAGDEDGLKRAEQEALAINPRGAELFHTIALAIESKFRYKDAVRYSDRALEANPEHWPAYVTLGINCLRTGEEERGRRFLEKSWEHDKFNVWVFNTRLLLKHMDKEYRDLRTDRFVFKFPKKDYDELSLYLAPLLEEAHAKLSAHYVTEIPAPVHIEAFSEHKWFSARTVGLEGFAASGACFGNLVTLTTPRALPQNWGAVAWHEFAHVVALHLTRHRVPRWLTEGLSVFEEGRDRPKWARVFEREIADTFASGRLLPIAELDFGFSKPKYPNQILISYFQGCLIVKHITEKWGWDSVLAILKGYGDNKSTPAIFREALGVSLVDFDVGFFEYVARWVEANGYEPTVAEEHVKALEVSSEEDPENVRKLVDLAWAYLTSGNNVDAPLKAGRALELDPANGDAHAVLGLDYFRQKNWPRAKDELGKALEGKTRFRFRTCSALGQVALKDGDKARAVELLEKAKEVSPRAGAAYPPGKNVYYQLADLYTQLGKEEDAVRQMEELSRCAPEDPVCRQRIATHYMKKEKDDLEAARKARDALEELLFINPFERGTHEFLARVAARLSDHDATIREYTYLLKFPETNPRTAYLALAKAHAAKGNAEEAAARARKVLELDPDNAEAKAILEKLGSGGTK